MKIKAFKDDKFTFLRKGIYDNDDISVMINNDSTFSYLDPIIEYDYSNYITRNSKLGLKKLKVESEISKNRFQKIKNFILSGSKICEIGAGSGFFLKYISEKLDHVDLFAIEKDQSTKEERLKIEKLCNSFDDIDDAIEKELKVDVILMHHVLEHIIEPEGFLKKIKLLLKDDGILIIEVPSLSDPLLNLYSIPEYSKFFYQMQHPYYYSMESLNKLLEATNFSISKNIYFQRYGLDNHMSWNKKPGLFEDGLGILSDYELNNIYKTKLEEMNLTDTIIGVYKINYRSNNV